MEGLLFLETIVAQVVQALAPILGTVDPVLVGRLLVVMVLCGAIGLERSEHERASGFRPHILVGLGACLMTMAGAYALSDVQVRDPMRVASYVVSGIGFLGAGAILRHGTTVRGLTTAASIWGSAGIGIATVLKVELSRPLRADQVPRLVKQLLVVKSISRVDVNSLQVEEVEALNERSDELISSIHAQIEEVKLNDENLLRDLNDSETGAPASAEKRS